MATMIDVLNVSTGRNSATVDKFPNRVMTGTYDAGFHTALMAKDLRLYVEMVERSGTASEVGTAVSAVWQAADAAMPGSDFTEIWKHISKKGDHALHHPLPRPAGRSNAARRLRRAPCVSREPAGAHGRAAHSSRTTARR